MELKKEELKKYEIIEKVINGEYSKKEAEEKLKLSRRQINRLVEKLNKQGKEGFIHKNRGKKIKIKQIQIS